MKLIHYPNRGLTTPCEPVETFDRSLHRQIQKLNYALDHFQLSSLSMNQIGGVEAIFSIISQDKSKKVLVNPHIVEQSMPKTMPETCGSFIDCIFQDILRPSKLTIEFIDFPKYDLVRETFRGPQARLIAHEMDHINGELTDGYVQQWRNRFLK
jgi:peptide deformylase